jgi:hypothetical protein
MPAKTIDETGNQHHRLTVLGVAKERKNGRIMWICQCMCGNEIQTDGYRLRHGLTKSCGCWKTQKMLLRNTANFKHVRKKRYNFFDDVTEGRLSIEDLKEIL